MKQIFCSQFSSTGPNLGLDSGSWWRGIRRATRGASLENFKTMHSNFDICRNFQRI